MRKYRLSQSKSQTGFLLLESMVALAILSVGIIGLTASQLTASKNNYSALLRTEAVKHSSTLIDQMRTNFNGVSTGDYDLAVTTIKAYIATPEPTLPSRADKDLREWADALSTDFAGYDPQAEVNCVGALAPVCEITISWNDARAENTLSPVIVSHVTHVNL